MEAAGDGQVAFTREDGAATLVEAAAGGHPLALEAPLAVAFDAGKGDRRVAVLLPGGLALVAGGARTTAGEAARETLFSSPGFADAMLHHHLPLGDKIRHRPDYWHTLARFGFGTIEPSTSPMPFAPMTSRRTGCAQPCDLLRAAGGQLRARGPGTASGVPPFPPGSDVKRGPFPGYLVSTTPVRVTCSGNVAGKAVELRVTAHVASIGIPTILSMTGRTLPHRARGRRPDRFPGVIVATGRVPNGTPPAGTTWVALVQGRLASRPGSACRSSSTCIATGTGSRPGRWATTRATPAGRHR